MKCFVDKSINYTKDDVQKTNESFVNRRYVRKEADLVYYIPKENLYFLIEHQSSNDQSMPYRVANYCMEIINDHVELDQLKNKGYTLPKIVPIVLYTGSKGWNAPNSLAQKYKIKDKFKNNCLNVEYVVIDINNYTQEELLEIGTSTSYAMLIEQNKGKEKLEDVLRKISERCSNDLQKAQMERIIRYILRPILGEDTDKMIEIFREREVRDMVKTAQDYIREEFEGYKRKARKEGLQEGRQEGRIEGIKEILNKIVKQMLQDGENVEKIERYTELSKEKIEEIAKAM